MIDKNIAGKTITLPGFIIQSAYGTLMHSIFEPKTDGYVLVMPCPITFTVPDDFNAVASEVEMLNRKIDSMADEYHGKVAQIKERIASLLCIENSPAEDIETAEQEDDEPSYCPSCNGSGEGQYDGTTCSTCKGRGE